MDWIIGIQRAIDHIEENLTREIDYERIAAEGFSSNYHFQRVFHILCGYTLGEYIRMRRLSLAGEELTKSKEKVIDIALKYGYDSPDSFTKAFQNFHGITPSQARADGMMLKSFSRLSIKISLEGGNTMNYRIEEKERFSVIEKVETHSTENEENKKSIPAFWERAYRDGTMETLLNITNDKSRIFGICYGGTSRDANTFAYSIAVPCNENAKAPEGFRKNMIGAQTFAVFPCTGAMPDAIQNTWQRIVSEFFPTSVYQPTYELDIEVYGEGDMDSADYQSEIWIPVKKN